MAHYSIKDLQNFTGIKAHTIRMWEKRYTIVEPKRTNTNIRYYDDDDLKKLINISILNRNGYKISAIASLSDSAISEEILSLAHTLNDFESQIEGLVVSMIDLDENMFEKIFNTAVIKMGFEDAVINILYPFFEKIGVLWQIGTITTSHNYFISNLVRQKIIVAIDGLVNSFTSKTKTYLLFLPEGEHHELGLLFYQYILKKNNYKIIYLGANVPDECLIGLTKSKKINGLMTSVKAPLKQNEFVEYIKDLSKKFNNKPIYISGFGINSLGDMLPENVSFFKNPREFKYKLNV
jgi:DNA-binding transcriptional MerR regulator